MSFFVTVKELENKLYTIKVTNHLPNGSSNSNTSAPMSKEKAIEAMIHYAGQNQMLRERNEEAFEITQTSLHDNFREISTQLEAISGMAYSEYLHESILKRLAGSWKANFKAGGSDQINIGSGGWVQIEDSENGGLVIPISPNKFKIQITQFQGSVFEIISAEKCREVAGSAFEELERM